MATRYPPALLSSAYAATGDKTVPPATSAGAGAGRFSQALGFPPITSKPIIQGGKPPERKDFNGAFYQLSTFALWFQQGGLMNYEASLTYEVGNEVLHDNIKYRCIKAGKGHQPPNATYWRNVDAPTGIVKTVNGQAPDAAGNVEIETGVPTASASVLGGIKVGNHLTITSGGVLSADPVVTQTASTNNAELPILAKNTNGTATITDTARFKSGVTLNPSLGRISATTFKGNFTGDAGSSTATTQAVGDNTRKLATTAFVQAALNAFRPVGAVMFFAMTKAPKGWLICDGRAVSRTTYADLYAAIGDLYGSGDGSTTFNLPNMVGRFAEGAKSGVGQSVAPGLPDITGTFSGLENAEPGTVTVFTGAFSSTDRKANGAGSKNMDDYIAQFKASDSNPIYGASSTVQPPAVKLLPCIRF